jgi:hypothetical protein
MAQTAISRSVTGRTTPRRSRAQVKAANDPAAQHLVAGKPWLQRLHGIATRAKQVDVYGRIDQERNQLT